MAATIHDCNRWLYFCVFYQPLILDVNNANVNYYTRAVVLMESLALSAHYFIFSNKAEAARSRIPLPDSRVTMVANNQDDAQAYVDLWLMTLCQHFIISNSTFSWWGAWLADCSDT